VSALIDWLNANAGAVTAAATTIYAAITLLLLFEARRARQLQGAAALTLWPTPWGDGLYLALRLENYGPAIARDVRLRFWYEREGTLLEGTDLSYADPVFGPGRRREFLPDTDNPKGAHLMLNALGEQGYVLQAELSWADDRLTLRGHRQRHTGHWTWPTDDLRHGFYTAHPLTDKELIPVFERKADKVIGALERISREAEYPRQRRETMEFLRRHEAEEAERAAQALTATEEPTAEDPE
jgi:hypothetical protein